MTITGRMFASPCHDANESQIFENPRVVAKALEIRPYFPHSARAAGHPKLPATRDPEASHENLSTAPTGPPTDQTTLSTSFRKSAPSPNPTTTTPAIFKTPKIYSPSKIHSLRPIPPPRRTNPRPYSHREAMDSFTAEEHLDFSPQESTPPRDRSNGNSRYSTGPRSPDGKAASSQNARTHGCCSKALLLPGESQDDFDDLHDRWISACQPDIPAATELVEKLIV